MTGPERRARVCGQPWSCSVRRAVIGEEHMGVDFDFSMLDAMDILDLAIYVEKEAEGGYEQ